MNAEKNRPGPAWNLVSAFNHKRTKGHEDFLSPRAFFFIPFPQGCFAKFKGYSYEPIELTHPIETGVSHPPIIVSGAKERG